jgi:hypothetical protein
VAYGSVAWGDVDNDGDLDILLTGSSVCGFVAKVYRNDGGAPTPTFTDIGAGLTGVSYSAAAWGDYDNDGDLDILLTGNDPMYVPVAKVYHHSAGEAPTVGTVIAPSGSGAVGVPTPFITSWQRPYGWQPLKQCYFHIGASPALPGNVTLMYNAQKDKLWLLNDSGTAWTGGCTPGSTGTLDNGQATVDCSLTTVHGYGERLAVAWAITFKNAFIGGKKTYLKCADVCGVKSAGQRIGTWTIE